MVALNCINCNAPLHIVEAMTRFPCGHCGFPLEVVRELGSTSLRRQQAVVPSPSPALAAVRPVNSKPEPALNFSPAAVAPRFTRAADPMPPIDRLRAPLNAAMIERTKELQKVTPSWSIIVVFLAAIALGITSTWWWLFIGIGVIWLLWKGTEGKREQVFQAFEAQLTPLARSILRHPACTDVDRRDALSALRDGEGLLKNASSPQSQASSGPSLVRTAAAAAGGALAGSVLANELHKIGSASKPESSPMPAHENSNANSPLAQEMSPRLDIPPEGHIDEAGADADERDGESQLCRADAEVETDTTAAVDVEPDAPASFNFDD